MYNIIIHIRCFPHALLIHTTFKVKIMKIIHTNSVNRSLYLIAALQCFVVVLFWGYLFLSETISLIHDTASNAYQTGENMLTQIESDMSVLSRTTLFPVNLSIFSNDDSICGALRKGSIEKNTEFGFTFYSHAQTQITSSSIDFIAIYDMEGNGVYFAQNDFIFRNCVIRKGAGWYTDILSAPIGSLAIVGPNEFDHSGIPDKDGTVICAVRSIVDPRHYKTIGVCVAGIQIADIDNAFSFSRLYPEQEYAIYLDSRLLSSNMDSPALPSYTAGRSQRIQWDFFNPCFYHTVFHGKNNAIVIRTPFSLILGQMLPLRVAVIIVLIFILCFITVTIFKIISNILTPLQYLSNACDMFEEDRIPTLPETQLPEELNHVFASFNRMSARINTLIHEVLIKDLEKHETELQLLRTQINPHYLYNTLEIIHMTAYKNHDPDVADMAELLGKNLQYGLRQSTKEVTLQEELEQLDVYLQILSYQYKDRLCLHSFIEPELLPCKTIKLLFQPMIENCVLHGFSSSGQNMTIDILGYRQEDTIVICVSDDGVGIDSKHLEKIKNELKKPESQSIGIRNVSRRIQLLYGQEYGLSIDSVVNQGTTVIVTLPYH